MYADYFQLAAEPFGLTPDPAFLYLSPEHREALAAVQYGLLDGRGFITLVGEVGTGKTTLLYSLLALRRPVVLSDEDKIDSMLETTCLMSKQEREDAMAFAAWASGQVADTNEIVRRFLPLWANALEKPQRQELVEMALQAAALGGAPTDAQASAIKRLSEGLLAK